jgi:hypothetical protein
MSARRERRPAPGAEADIAYRARVLADNGVAAVFDDLHHDVR